MNYQIFPILQGLRKEPLDGALFMLGTKPGDLYQIPYGFFALKSEDGEALLIDSGILSSKTCEEWHLTLSGEDGTPTNQEALFKTTGIRAEEVKHIILTHLHWDHCCDLENFPNAKIYVQKEELHHFILPYPNERMTACMWEATNGPHWLPSLLRFEVLDGECEVLPGIRVVLTPGHTSGHQSVIVDTKEGQYLILGDYVHMKKSLDLGIPEGVYSSLSDWYDTLPKVQALMEEGCIPLCTHEITIYDRTYG